MTFIQMVIAFIIVYLCVYALIGRICQCIEHCATARAYSKLKENGVSVSLENLQRTISKFKEKPDVEQKVTEK